MLFRSTGPLDWRSLLQWLRDDALIGADEASATKRRFTGANSAQHPLARSKYGDFSPSGVGWVISIFLTAALAGLSAILDPFLIILRFHEMVA